MAKDFKKFNKFGENKSSYYKKEISRRNFLKLSGLGVLSLAASSYGLNYFWRHHDNNGITGFSSHGGGSDWSEIVLKSSDNAIYFFKATGRVEAKSLDNRNETFTNMATGELADDQVYRFKGKITELRANGDLEVLIDGEKFTRSELENAIQTCQIGSSKGDSISSSSLAEDFCKDYGSRVERPISKSDFGNVVDAVDDLGCDPSGGDDSTQKIEDALEGGNTLVEFPDGTYLIEDLSVNGGMIGMAAKDNADPVFVTPDTGNDDARAVELNGSDVLFQGIDFDYTDRRDRGGPMLSFEVFSGGMLVKDVEIKGYVHRRGLRVSVSSENAEGLVENFRLLDGQRTGYLGSAVLVNQASHEGPITFYNCVFRHMISGGIYCSPGDDNKHMGAVKVLNCRFENNSTAGIRLGNKGDEVKGCVFVNDRSLSGKNVEWDKDIPKREGFDEPIPRMLRFRGTADTAEGKSYIENCQFRQNVDLDASEIVSLRGDYSGGAHLKNCKIEHSPSESNVIHARNGEEGVKLENVVIEGSGATGASAAIDTNSRRLEVLNSCINMSGSGVDGITHESSDYEIRNTSITVDGEQIDANGGIEENISSGEKCSYQCK